VGGSANSLHKLVGAELGAGSLARSMEILAGSSADEVARRFEVDVERARLLPAGVVVFEALASALGRALTIGKGGLREGVILELLTR
jgi:exopolyphosphatase/guanosine-5'-triphosphate,3'-diphosphate pyrophosphatase